ncbi:hypothetical protein E2562_035669, partial [Oryza meyeriana var. granulata]
MTLAAWDATSVPCGGAWDAEAAGSLEDGGWGSRGLSRRRRWGKRSFGGQLSWHGVSSHWVERVAVMRWHGVLG